MFNNQNGGSAPANQRINVNTTLQSFFGPGMMFTIALWNDKVSLSWTPSLGQDSNGVTRYDRDHRINTALSAKKIAALIQSYDKKLKKYVEDDEPVPEGGKSIGVWVGGNRNSGVLPGIFLITVVTNQETGKPQVILSIVKNVTEMGANPENITSYTCQDTEVIIDYNPAIGGQTVEETYPCEFDVFMMILRHHVDSFGFSVHGKKYSDAMFPSKNNQNGSTSSQFSQNPANIGIDSSFAGSEYELPFN